MKIILAGPGTGKTTKVKSIIRNDYSDANNILVLSFTNATINDLKSSFSGFENVSCYTLHSYALKINHLPALHVLDDDSETPVIRKYSDKLEINFNELCSFLQCIRFKDMIKQCISFIKENRAYAVENIGSLDLLIVDEFQDFNEVERELVYLLSNHANETLILGDDDQSIYGFKDADPDGIISLYNDANVEKIEHENKCYRCPDIIVDYCSNLIRRNKHRVEKEWKKSNKEGEVVFEQKLTQAETHKYICNEIENIKKHSQENSILILSPVGFYIDQLKELLKAEGIEYVDFWTTKISLELRLNIWWLKALYSDHKILFILLLGKTLKLLNKKSFMDILEKAFRENFDEQSLIEQIDKYFPKPYSNYLTSSIPISDFFSQHSEFQEFKEHIDEEDVIDSLNSLERNINPILSFREDSVNIMSIHKSKGLQADYVFIIGLNEGVIPNDIRGIDTIEAQRRLLFVGMTITLKRLFMISTVEWEGKYVHKVDKSQFKYKYVKKLYYGKTSRFVGEMKA